MPNYKFYLNRQFSINFLILGLIMVSPFAMAEGGQLSLYLGQLDQDYKEIDGSGLTGNGVLNSETGSIPVLELGITNTLDPIILLDKYWTPYGQLQLSYASGESDYNGYLQSGSTLTPYKTHTDNKMTQINFDLGLGYQLNPYFTVTPLMSISHHRWQRELERYNEEFRHTAFLAGTNIDWQPSGQMPLSLELQVKVGKILDSNIDVPKLGLNQDIGHSNIRQLGIVGHYQLSKQLSVNAGVSRKNFKYEKSNIENEYQYPDSESKQTLWQLSLGYEF